MTADTHCGHPSAAIVSSDEGTSYCRWCEDVGKAREEGRREGMDAVAAVLDDGFDPWPAVKRTVNVEAMDHRARSGLDAILDAVIADACRAIRALASTARESVARVDDVEGGL